MLDKKTQRNFILGDTWLYYKIYTGVKTSDTIITEIIKPVADKLLELKIIDKWFFIRYSDPNHHLRVRFHCPNIENIDFIIKLLLPHFKNGIKNDIIWKIQVDTYKREFERYGENTIELAEDLFYYDSEMIADFLSLIEDDVDEDLRWLFSLKAIDLYLNIFDFTEVQKLNLMNYLKIGFGQEFGMSRILKRQLDNRYRDERKKIEQFLSLQQNKNPKLLLTDNIILNKAEKIKIVSFKILKLNDEKQLQVSVEELISSYLHMSLNRIFKSRNRLHEMVCYDFLHRYYKSKVAIKKQL